LSFGKIEAGFRVILLRGPHLLLGHPYYELPENYYCGSSYHKSENLNRISIVIVPDPFFPTHTQKEKKWSGYARLNQELFEQHLAVIKVATMKNTDDFCYAKEAITCNHQINAFHCQER